MLIQQKIGKKAFLFYRGMSLRDDHAIEFRGFDRGDYFLGHSPILEEEKNRVDLTVFKLED